MIAVGQSWVSWASRCALFGKRLWQLGQSRMLAVQDSFLWVISASSVMQAPQSSQVVSRWRQPSSERWRGTVRVHFSEGHATDS